jgi:hypothetical protein
MELLHRNVRPIAGANKTTIASKNEQRGKFGLENVDFAPAVG